MQQQSIHSILKRYWGYDTFRQGQAEVIQSVCSGVDTLALMPTGAGKSLLYQIPGLWFEGVCIVVTPLVALMKDQTDRLRGLGINAAAIHSGLSKRQIDIIFDNCVWGDVKFLYIAPERISEHTFITRAAKMNVSFITVDEAHCISQWGYDFRPSYLKIKKLREIHPNVPILALTATATSLVAKDIKKHLGMDECSVYQTTFARPSISFVVRKCDDKRSQMLRVIRNVGGCGIVYTRTREQTEKLAEFLNKEGIAAEFYHGGMIHSQRNDRQERWIKGEVQVMVATNAFGMGIDKADVRFVIHYDICESPEAYYQEAGRAGRDGKRSYAVLLTSSDDKSKAIKKAETEFPPLETIRMCYEALFNYLQIAIGEGKYYTFTFNIHEFANRARIYTGLAANCLKVLQQNGYLVLTDETDNPPRIMFLVNRDDLYKIRIDRKELDHIILTLLRLYSGLFHNKLVAINSGEIAQYSGYTVERVHELLKMLWDLRVIKYVPGVKSPMLTLHEERLPVKDVYIDPELYQIKKQLTLERLEAIYSYADNTEICRSVILQSYFGEEDAQPCGVCDICLENKRREEGSTLSVVSKEVEDSVRRLLSNGPMTVKDIADNLRLGAENVVATLDHLMEKGIIYSSANGKLKLKK